MILSYISDMKKGCAYNYFHNDILQRATYLQMYIYLKDKHAKNT